MKLDQVARQALEALEVSTDWDVGAKGKQLQSMKAITAMREALAEQAEQEPVALHKVVADHIADLRACVHTLQQYPEMASTMREVIKAADELESALNFSQAEQEPVAWMFVNDDGECEEIGYGKDYLKGSEVMADFQPLFAAPVRTKDLTNDEIDDVRDKTWCLNNSLREFARAVIAADREKNNGTA